MAATVDERAWTELLVNDFGPNAGARFCAAVNPDELLYGFH
jgi:hypothetical protein